MARGYTPIDLRAATYREVVRVMREHWTHIRACRRPQIVFVFLSDDPLYRTPADNRRPEPGLHRMRLACDRADTWALEYGDRVLGVYTQTVSLGDLIEDAWAVRGERRERRAA